MNFVWVVASSLSSWHVEAGTGADMGKYGGLTVVEEAESPKTMGCEAVPASGVW